MDGDGHSTPNSCEGTQDDCDDSDPDNFPGNAEVCDGADNDCDQVADDGLTFDVDGDGHSTPGSCEGTQDDCDDNDPDNYPGNTEVCDNADNDCDQVPDNGACIDISNVPESTLWEGTDPLVIDTAVTIDTETGEISGIRAAGTGLVSGIWFDILTQVDGPDLGVFSAAGITVTAEGWVDVVGANPLVMVSSADATIDGAFDLTGGDGADALSGSGPNAGGTGVAGGAVGGDGSDGDYSGATDGAGAGGGFIGIAGVHYGNGGGGGGLCWGGGGGMGDRPSIAGSPGTELAGGAGGYNGGDGGRGGDGGDPYGELRLVPLEAGSGGAGGLSDTDHNPDGGGAGAGAGGGGIQISAQGSLAVGGLIDASAGRGGDAWGGGGGGGSGGAVLLEAVDVDVSGGLYAEGGRGGHGNWNWQPGGLTGGAAGGGASPGGGGGGLESGGGGGAAGYLLLRYQTTGTVSGVLSPDATTTCASAEAM